MIPKIKPRYRILFPYIATNVSHYVVPVTHDGRLIFDQNTWYCVSHDGSFTLN